MISRAFWGVVLSLFFLGNSYAENSCEEYQKAEFERALHSFLFERYDDFQVTRLFSKDEDKLQSLKVGLGDSFAVGANSVDYEELYFKAVSEAYEAHIGVAIIRYPDVVMASKARSRVKPQGYFHGTKILTRYILFGDRNCTVVVYSESAKDKRVVEFMGSIQAIYSE